MRLDNYLRDQGVSFEHRTHVPTYTAQDLAAAEHISGNAVAKSVVVRADDRYIVCALPASYKLDLNKLAAMLGANDCRLADEQEMAELFPDAELGAEPPFGHLYSLDTIVDRHLTEDERILFSAGSHRDAIIMRYDDFARLERPRVADISIHA